ncbi:VOC family protein [Microbacterium hibisci]|uniref:VOC family protein n=1 Tax=Microbacterium hibisci TaxID=2036000 RepID=UPI0019433B31|nr:VOC family protein [Microbacterium hibisci]
MIVRSLFPILATPDLARLAGFYEAALGASVAYRFPAEDGSGDVYVSLALGGASLGIGLDPAASEPAAHDRVALWFYVDDVDGAFRDAVAAGATVVREPADMPWGERVAQVRDVDGNLVNLGAEPRPAAEG